jgi:hypothetical protein
MLILLLSGSGIMVLFSVVLWLLPIECRTSSQESFEQSSRRRDRYLEQMRRDRFENVAANHLQERPFVGHHVE